MHRAPLLVVRDDFFASAKISPKNASVTKKFTLTTTFDPFAELLLGISTSRVARDVDLDTDVIFEAGSRDVSVMMLWVAACCAHGSQDTGSSTP